MGKMVVMPAIADRYRKLTDHFSELVAAVPDDRWDAPTPCKEWTVRDLVNHVIETQGMFLQFVGREVGPSPSMHDDPHGAFDAARSAVQEALDDPAVAATEFDGMAGRSRFDVAVDRFLCTDQVVHGWDLARAAGLDESIEAEELTKVHEMAKSMGDMGRSRGAFGPPLEVSDDAPQKDRVLAFLGRQP